MIQMHYLKQLAVIAKNRTLSEAAEELGVTQSALSKSMQKLEQLLGVELFERRKNRITLNERGLYAAKLSEKLIIANEEAVEKIRSFK